MLSVSVPHVCYRRPVWDLDGSFSVSSVFKSLLCWRKADPHMCSFGINPGDHQNFTESLFWALPSLPYFYGFSLVSGSLRLFSSIFQLESWGFGYPTLPCTSAALPGSCQRIHTDKVMRLAPSSWDHNCTNWKGRFSSLRTLVPATSPCHHHRIGWKLVCIGMKEMAFALY